MWICERVTLAPRLAKQAPPFGASSMTGGSGMLWSKWMAGPQAAATGELLVSFTDFTTHRYVDLVPAARAGFELRRGWADMTGAVGMWLWFAPMQRRCGSLSIWMDESALRSFVRSPQHSAIVRAYRNRGTMRSDMWPVDSTTARREIRAVAQQRLLQA